LPSLLLSLLQASATPHTSTLSLHDALPISRPRMRSKRISTSWITLLRPWPVWRIAVMLGGGMTITYGSCDESTRAVNTPRSSQRWYRRRSTACGSYWGGSSKRRCGIPYNRQDGGGWWRLVEVGGRIRSHG